MKEEKSFFSDCRKRIITHISIVDAVGVNQNKVFSSEYILYIFKVVSPFNSWYIKKRYSEIQEIYNFLVNHKPKLKFPLFPPKRLFSTKESTIIERKNGFEILFSFILQNIEILQYKKLIDFFKINKTLLLIYLKNCILVNENRLGHEIIDENSSSSNSNDFSSLGSDQDYFRKNHGQVIDIQTNNNINNKQKEENLFNKNEKEKKLGNNLDDNKIDNNGDNADNSNIINEEIIITNSNNKASNVRKIIESQTNYFKCYEEYKLSLGNYKSRSQVSFFIIKEFLRNLKVHSSHIFEIINDFTEYMKLKKKWKKFNEKEIKALLIGINKDYLFEDYFQVILNEKNVSDKHSMTSSSEKSTLSSTANNLNLNNINIKNINNSYSFGKEIVENDGNDNNQIDSYYLEGLFYYIGNFEENYFGARSCLLLLNKFFERNFNPEVDIYINIFQKIDIKFIKKMNLCKLSTINNCINQKLCFDIINLYIKEYDEEEQIKILRDLNADDQFINRFLDSAFIDESKYSSFNLE